MKYLSILLSYSNFGGRSHLLYSKYTMGAINFDSVLALGLSLLPYDDDDVVYHSTDLGITKNLFGK